MTTYLPPYSTVYAPDVIRAAEKDLTKEELGEFELRVTAAVWDKTVEDYLEKKGKGLTEMIYYITAKEAQNILDHLKAEIKKRREEAVDQSPLEWEGGE